MDPFEMAELELGLEEGELQGTFPAWLVGRIKDDQPDLDED